jgi:hypothetical protein
VRPGPLEQPGYAESVDRVTRVTLNGQKQCAGLGASASAAPLALKGHAPLDAPLIIIGTALIALGQLVVNAPSPRTHLFYSLLEVASSLTAVCLAAFLFATAGQDGGKPDDAGKRMAARAVI